MDDPRKGLVESGYDALGESFTEWTARVEGDPRNRYLAELVRLLPDRARTLDLGCGSGLPSTRLLAERFDVVGIDVSASQVALARRNVPQATFIHGDVVGTTFPAGSFAAVTALYSISHLPRDEHGQLFGDVFEWLQPGGLFLATLGAGDTPDWTGEWLGVGMFFSAWDAERNRALLRAAGFELLVDELVEIREPEGPVTFLWVLARKPG